MKLIKRLELRLLRRIAFFGKENRSYSNFFSIIELDIYLTDFNKFTDILTFILGKLVRIN